MTTIKNLKAGNIVLWEGNVFTVLSIEHSQTTGDVTIVWLRDNGRFYTNRYLATYKEHLTTVHRLCK